jgi:peptidoglycan/LPS O-acetylase OafA/YrhL
MELLFYLLAPFLAHLSKRWFMTVVILYMVGFFGIVLPLNLLPLNLLHMFLSHFIYFLLGMMSYSYLYVLLAKKKINLGILRGIFCAFLAYLLLYNFMPVHVALPAIGLDDVLYYLLFVVCMPFIFLLTKANAIDNVIGKLSYPVYITHFFITKLVSNIPLFAGESTLRTVIIIVASILFSYVLVKLIEDPIDRFRQKRVKR